MKKITFIAAMLAACAAFAGQKADADLAKIHEHFTLRSADFDQSKSNWRWVFYGDSITHGCGHTDGWRSFPEIFAERIRWEKAALFDPIINSGNSGYSSTHLVRDRQYDYQVRSFRPNVVFLMIGANDIVLADASIERFRDNLVKLVEMIRADGAIPILMTYNTIKLFENPTKKWQHDYVKRYNEFPAYIEAIRSVSKQMDTILVDHWAYWSAQSDIVRDSWLGDHLHPNGRGHLEMARIILQTLKMDANSQCLSINPGGLNPGATDSKEAKKDFALFEKANYIVNENADALAAGTNWHVKNPQKSTIENGVLKMDMRNGHGGYYMLKDKAKLAALKGKVACEIDMCIPHDSSHGSYRFYIEVAAGAGQEVTEPILLIGERNISGTMGKLPMPVKAGEFFKIRILFDTDTRNAKLWIDDTFLTELTIKPVTKSGARLGFGNGSSSIGGEVLIRSVKVGPVEL